MVISWEKLEPFAVLGAVFLSVVLVFLEQRRVLSGDG